MGNDDKAKEKKAQMWEEYLREHGKPPPVPPSITIAKMALKAKSASAVDGETSGVGASSDEEVDSKSPNPDDNVDPAMAAQSFYTAGPSRRIVEYCCGIDSALGRDCNRGSCVVKRMTIKENMATKFGKECALDAVKGKTPCLSWGSIPCTWGGPRHKMNPYRF